MSELKLPTPDEGAFLSVPDNNDTPWLDEILNPHTTKEQYYNLLKFVPVIAWFSSKKLAIRQLHKVNARLGDDLWIIVGRDNPTLEPDALRTIDGSETELNVTINPLPLAKIVRYLTPENGWVKCEFMNEITFYKTALDYLEINT